MPRPKKEPMNKMGKPIPIRFLIKDRIKIEEAAHKAHIPIAIYCRKKILESLNQK